MSALAGERLLVKLAQAGAVLAADREGGFGVYAGGDRRRRPAGRASAQAVEALAGAGALQRLADGGYALSDAGRARVRRAQAAGDESWRAQHDEIGPRAVMDSQGALRAARGLAPGGAMARLARLADARGSAFFAAEEIAAGARLCADWAAGQVGLLRGSDWSAPPRGGSPRGAGGGIEAARAAAVDARRRVEAALAALAAPAAAIVRAACFGERGLESIERETHWPARSAKVALKLGLAQLALYYRGA